MAQFAPRTGTRILSATRAVERLDRSRAARPRKRRNSGGSSGVPQPRAWAAGNFVFNASDRIPVSASNVAHLDLYSSTVQTGAPFTISTTADPNNPGQISVTTAGDYKIEITVTLALVAPHGSTFVWWQLDWMQSSTPGTWTSTTASATNPKLQEIAQGNERDQIRTVTWHGVRPLVIGTKYNFQATCEGSFGGSGGQWAATAGIFLTPLDAGDDTAAASPVPQDPTDLDLWLDETRL